MGVIYVCVYVCMYAWTKRSRKGSGSKVKTANGIGLEKISDKARTKASGRRYNSVQFSTS